MLNRTGILQAGRWGSPDQLKQGEDAFTASLKGYGLSAAEYATEQFGMYFPSWSLGRVRNHLVKNGILKINLLPQLYYPIKNQSKNGKY